MIWCTYVEYIDSNTQEYGKKIIKALKEHPEGLSIMEIAELIGVHRHTVIKYIYNLIGLGLIWQRKIGPAKLCYLKDKGDKK